MKKERLMELAGVVEADDPGPWTHEGAPEEVLHQVRRDLKDLSFRLEQVAARPQMSDDLRQVAKQAETLLDQARMLIFSNVK